MWREYFNRKAADHQGSPMASDYFSEKSFRDHRDSILAWLGPQRERRVLDAGCGVGVFAEPLTAANQVYGADVAELALGYARARGLRVVRADLDRLPFAASGFDLVLCIAVLQHVPDETAMLRELCAQVKPGGQLVLQTLNANSLQRKMLAYVVREKTFDRLVAPEQLRRALADLGLDQIELLYQYYPLSLTTRSARATGPLTWLSTSFAIRGRRPPASATGSAAR